jgi:hypothetical protein
MLGELIGETKGKRLVRRVLSTDPLTAEVSFEEQGTILGVAYNGFGTYTAAARADGTVLGEGQGAMLTADGEPVTWKGSGLGKLGPGGALSYRGILYFRTASTKLARLNSAPGVFEYEVDPSGSTTTRVWEWK